MPTARELRASVAHVHMDRLEQRERLTEFVRESNLIEGIDLAPSEREVDAHVSLLAAPALTVVDVCRFVEFVAPNAALRNRLGRDVVVGGHRPPRGGPRIEDDLRTLLGLVNDGRLTPYNAHVSYELLHPFTDCNGRSGRAIWAWQMRIDGKDPFIRPFLQSWYYASLDAARVDE